VTTSLKTNLRASRVGSFGSGGEGARQPTTVDLGRRPGPGRAEVRRTARMESRWSDHGCHDTVVPVRLMRSSAHDVLVVSGSRFPVGSSASTPAAVHERARDRDALLLTPESHWAAGRLASSDELEDLGTTFLMSGRLADDSRANATFSATVLLASSRKSWNSSRWSGAGGDLRWPAWRRRSWTHHAPLLGTLRAAGAAEGDFPDPEDDEEDKSPLSCRRTPSSRGASTSCRPWNVFEPVTIRHTTHVC